MLAKLVTQLLNSAAGQTPAGPVQAGALASSGKVPGAARGAFQTLLSQLAPATQTGGAGKPTTPTGTAPAREPVLTNGLPGLPAVPNARAEAAGKPQRMQAKPEGDPAQAPDLAAAPITVASVAAPAKPDNAAPAERTKSSPSATTPSADAARTGRPVAQTPAHGSPETAVAAVPPPKVTPQPKAQTVAHSGGAETAAVPQMHAAGPAKTFDPAAAVPKITAVAATQARTPHTPAAPTAAPTAANAPKPVSTVPVGPSPQDPAAQAAQAQAAPNSTVPAAAKQKAPNRTAPADRAADRAAADAAAPARGDITAMTAPSLNAAKRPVRTAGPETAPVDAPQPGVSGGQAAQAAAQGKTGAGPAAAHTAQGEAQSPNKAPLPSAGHQPPGAAQPGTERPAGSDIQSLLTGSAPLMRADGAAAALPGAPIHVSFGAVPFAAAAPDALAFMIAREVQGGLKRFEIRLDPPELGRLDVRIEFQAEGRGAVHVAVDKPETLELLQRDARALERALREAGLDLGNGGLSLSLKRESEGEARSPGGHDRFFGHADDDAATEAAGHSEFHTHRQRVGGVDLMI